MIVCLNECMYECMHVCVCMHLRFKYSTEYLIFFKPLH